MRTIEKKMRGAHFFFEMCAFFFRLEEENMRIVKPNLLVNRRSIANNVNRKMILTSGKYYNKNLLSNGCLLLN